MSFIMILLIFSTPFAIASPVKVLKYQNSVRTIVNDLIDNWQSPIVYLKSRGYLPKDMDSVSELDFENKLQNNVPQEMSQPKQSLVDTNEYPAQSHSKLKIKFHQKSKPNVELKKTEHEPRQEVAFHESSDKTAKKLKTKYHHEDKPNIELKEIEFEPKQGALTIDHSDKTSKKLKTKYHHEDKPNMELKEIEYDANKFKRANRSFEDKESIELKNMFQTLFSTNDNTISDEIKTKLNVPWDMNALKFSARDEANKYFEKFCNKRNENAFNKAAESDLSLQEQVAQLYPSVLESKNMHWGRKYNDLEDSSPYKKPDYLTNIAKMLSSPKILNAGKTSYPFHKQKLWQMHY
ncbi:uncharacterized protein Dwil_GK19408 [Drosophila willistoni]|uniref:GK19408 n=1 Tax=Drosophila willistoni TaxID=7260 RepID=B4MQH4_DROWI|nr:uncharacterized protein LOC6640463 [Drosophila willistoni]EDW74363.1 uncharacterized protein Dwil_GK19408 [Drosophila willistoni]